MQQQIFEPRQTTVESKMALRKHLFKLQHELTKRIITLDTEIYALKREQARSTR